MPITMKLLKKYIINLGLLSLFFFGTASADVLFLDQYFKNMQSLESGFKQTVKQGKKNEISTGSLLLKRDTGFKFIYEKPFKQEIILNKAQNKLWQIDIDLQQVIVKKIDLNDQTNPISFLLSQQPISELFDVKVEKDRLRYILTPKTRNTKSDDQIASVKKLTIIFKNGTLHQFSAIHDTDSNVDITLVNPKFNQSIALANFIFNPKSYPNIDIIDETEQ